MPELPELEVLRGNLDKELNGKKVKSVEVAVPATVKRNGNKRHFATAIEGAKLGGTTRLGTLLLTELDSGSVLVFDLAERGGLLRAQAKDAAKPATLLTITFTQHGQLRVFDPAKKTEVYVASRDEVEASVGELGFDLVAEPVSWTAFGERLIRRQGKLKAILMDPTFLVGVGPMYSDEVLFEAGLRYDRDPKTLSTQEIRRLYRAMVEKVHDALKYNGSTVGEDGFVDLFGKPGGYQGEIAVYRRDGEMSPRARGPIVKTRFGQGYTYYCAQTQV